MTARLGFDDALDLLEAHDCHPRLTGNDQAYARCPNHEDRKPSLSVGVGHDGKLLVYCHAGCEYRDVIAAMGGANPNGYRPDPERVARVKAKPHLRFGQTDAYRYIAIDGTHLIKLRGTFTDPETGEVADAKAFVRKWWTSAAWSPGDGGHTPALYKPDVIDQAARTGERLHICEGEKDADRLNSLGLLATTPPHGAGKDIGKKWRDEWTRQLGDVTDLVVIADDDEPGRAHATNVAAKLHAHRPDRAVPVFLPATGCKDVSDHLDAGHALTELRELPTDDGDDEFGISLLADVDDTPVSYRIADVLPTGGRCVLIGQRKLGKTHLALNLCRSLLLAEPFLGRFEVVRVTGTVAFLNSEVSRQMFAGWARQAGLPPDRLVVANTRGLPSPFTDPKRLNRFAARLTARGVQVIVLDTFGRLFGGRSQNDAADVSSFLLEVDRLARLAGIGEVILTAHAGWTEDGRARGSSALEDWPDSLMRLTGDEQKARYLAVEGRDVEVDEQQLEFDPATRRITFTALPINRKQAREQANVNKLVPEVLAVVKSTKKPTASDIVEKLGGRRQTGFTAVSEAKTRGLIREEKHGRGTVYYPDFGSQNTGNQDHDQTAPDQQPPAVPSSPYIERGNREPDPHDEDASSSRNQDHGEAHQGQETSPVPGSAHIERGNPGYPPCSVCGSDDGIVIDNGDPRCHLHYPDDWTSA